MDYRSWEAYLKVDWPEGSQKLLSEMLTKLKIYSGKCPKRRKEKRGY